MANEDFFDTWMADFEAREVRLGASQTVTMEMKGFRFSFEKPAVSLPHHISNISAFGAITTEGYEKKANLFNENPRKAIKAVYQLYKDVRTFLKPDMGNIVTTIAKDIDDKDNHDLTTLILRYVILGECTTRLGEKISRPDKKIEDVYFDVLLDVARIVFEDRWNKQFKLPWLENDTTDLGKKCLKWEKRAGDLGDYAGGAFGRAVAAVAATAISPFVKLPDEATKAVGFLFGITARKTSEVVVGNEIIKNPDSFS
jgi:hypothetical protein